MRQVDATILSLATAGFGRGDRVALALPNGPEMAVALLAVTGCATCVPLNPALDETSYLVALQTLRVDVLIVPEGEDTPAVRAAHSMMLPTIGLAFSPVDPAGTFTFVAGSSRPAVASGTPVPEDVALVLHTSGTTARPKAVPLTQRLLVEPSLARARHLRLTSADRCLCVAPLFAGMGIRLCLFPVLVRGGSVVCTPGLQGNSFFQWLDEFEPTFYTGAPAVHRAVLDELNRRGGTPRSTLRFIGTGSAALPGDVEGRLESAFGVPVVQAYSMTETGVIAQNPLPPGHRRSGSVGLPVSNEYAILDGGGAFLSPDGIGEIVVRGPGVFRGYEDNPEADLQAFFEGWFRTGDLGYVDHDGYLFIVGRVKELINRGGFKVSPSAVDTVVMRHPEVVDAGTFSVPHATLGEDVVTAVVLRKPVHVSSQEVRDFAFEHLPAFMVPSQIVPVPALRRTPAGKLQRGDLAKLLAPRLRAEFLAPRDPNEEMVAGFFAEVLGIEGIGAFDNFFELGGDSLRGTQFVTRVNSVLRSNLEVANLFKRPTVAEFAAELAGAAGNLPQSGLPPVRPMRRSIYRPDAAGAKPVA
jgi:acyl-CoA synthetase (AMP-forming)/AMP-acid ligase II